MLTLTIQTCIAPYQLILSDENKSLQSIAVDFPLTQTLFTGLEEILTQAQVKKTDLKQIQILIGPGSFSGIRTGLAFAKGLAAGFNIPLKGGSLFDLYINQNVIAAFSRTKRDAFTALITNKKIDFFETPMTAVALKELSEKYPAHDKIGNAWHPLCNETVPEENPPIEKILKTFLNSDHGDTLKPLYGDTLYAKPAQTS